jgi:hypothetical protein
MVNELPQSVDPASHATLLVPVVISWKIVVPGCGKLVICDNW